MRNVLREIRILKQTKDRQKTVEEIFYNCCSLVLLKLVNGWADLVDFGYEIFVVVQGRINGEKIQGKKTRAVGSFLGQLVFYIFKHSSHNS